MLFAACQPGVDFNHAPKWHVVESVTYKIQIATFFNVATALTRELKMSDANGEYSARTLIFDHDVG